MPGIKKKWIKASHDDQTVKDLPNDSEDIGDEDRELGVADGESATHRSPSKPRKRPAQSSLGGMLKGLDGEVLLEKRKRFVPPAELKLSEWLEHNLEKRTEEALPLTQLYHCYTQLCLGTEIMDVPLFNRMIREKFGKSFGFKELSEYKNLIKERKINKTKKAGSGIKIRDVIVEAINFYGNPWHGVRFFTLKQYIGTKYPALQIDQRTKLLKRNLELGTQGGHFELVKGIGMAGFYKLPGGEEKPPPKPKNKKKKAESDSKGQPDEGEATEGTGNENGDSTEKSQEESTEDGEKKEEASVEKKKQTKKKVQKVEYSKMRHGNPRTIEEVFPLAITYQSAPKVVGIGRIKKYIDEKYPDTHQKFRHTIDKGLDKGDWEYASSSGLSRRLHLLMDDFDPQADQLEDQICAAIIACHEPKAASASQIKKYISQYHPDFGVERTDRFKKALLRAISKNIIVQVTGLGATGSFQLTAPFIPSPLVLAGEDDLEDEEDIENENFYIPRGTKSRGMPKVKTMAVITSKSHPRSAGFKRKLVFPVKSKSKKVGKRRNNTTDEEDEDTREIVTPQKKKLQAKNKKKGKPTGKKRVKPAEEKHEKEEKPEYTPRKSKSRGGDPIMNSASIVLSRTKTVGNNGTASQTKAKLSDDDLHVSSTPSRTPKSPSKQTPKGKRTSLAISRVRKGVTDDSDADDESDASVEYTPRKSKSRSEEHERQADTSHTKEKKGRKRSRK